MREIEKQEIGAAAYYGREHMSRDALCFSCLYKDERPELGFNSDLIYCIKKEIVVRPKMKCDLYVRSTDEGKEEMRNMMYGMMMDNDLQEE
jgi:hypothetical protein